MLCQSTGTYLDTEGAKGLETTLKSNLKIQLLALHLHGTRYSHTTVTTFPFKGGAHPWRRGAKSAKPPRFAAWTDARDARNLYYAGTAE